MRYFAFLGSALLSTCALLVGSTCAQRVDFPDQPVTAPPLVPVPQTFAPQPGSPITPVTPTPQPPAATLGTTIQPFDPYAAPGAAPVFTPVPAGAPQFGTAPPVYAPATPGLPPQTAPPGVAPPGLAPPPYGQPGQTTPWLPPAYGQPTPYDSPPVGQLTPGPVDAVSPGPYSRLFQDTGLRYAWLGGSGSNAMALNEMDASTTAHFPRFFKSSDGLRVTPGFGLTLTSGPQSPDVPPTLYAAYLNFGWNPKFSPTVSADMNFRTGVYSDFQTFTRHSLRVMGSGVGVFRIAPTGSLKLGVAYIDRNDIKLLPAIGLLWEPNEQTRWDLFFPAPKLSNYWKTVGNRKIWWYLGGEYGGGSWTIEATGGTSERIDINDIRVYVGLDVWKLERCHYFIELGYVFNRDLVFVVRPEDSTQVDDTFMLRGGISF